MSFGHNHQTSFLPSLLKSIPKILWNLFVTLVYFTTSKSQILRSITFATNSTICFLYSICSKNSNTGRMSSEKKLVEKYRNSVNTTLYASYIFLLC
ncbi:hypothetical protein BCV72DRAFT_24355 [Rhizopus microsporus var. microsporus]|uniref:Uncharacterized protein n=1 Tax=Rhizopus microsporus var. microsporus TaxID=86635 RepID=A0A1X0QVV2_RHIZD|nr:hypothetical protein BCV72DRAFT_24355 [Rhizopus microsporus var. microsporus]